MSDRGSVTLWVLGLTVMVFFLGGISLDLWRAFDARQELAAMADSAAVAGAAHIDGATFRDTGQLRLDPTAAIAAAHAHLDAQPGTATIAGRTITAAGAVLSVRLDGEVDFTLLRVFLGPGTLPVSATGWAEALPAP